MRAAVMRQAVIRAKLRNERTGNGTPPQIDMLASVQDGPVRAGPCVGDALRTCEVGAGGVAAVGVREDVVGVGPADPLPAGGEAAGAVPGGE